mmetsp:Transcript_54376/g.119020  ORF Transcript_54376/g.119020 Transcript_54376/m.119020 type:complete len:266 (-) Transcript_54376:1031-1828(-)
MPTGRDKRPPSIKATAVHKAALDKVSLAYVGRGAAHCWPLASERNAANWSLIKSRPVTPAAWLTTACTVGAMILRESSIMKFSMVSRSTSRGIPALAPVGVKVVWTIPNFTSASVSRGETKAGAMQPIDPYWSTLKVLRWLVLRAAKTAEETSKLSTLMLKRKLSKRDPPLKLHFPGTQVGSTLMARETSEVTEERLNPPLMSCLSEASATRFLQLSRPPTENCSIVTLISPRSATGTTWLNGRIESSETTPPLPTKWSMQALKL